VTTARSARLGLTRAVAIAVSVAALVTAVNASKGGYFSQSWGWIALAFLAAVSLALIVGSASSPGFLRIAFAGVMALLGVWVALSATWSLSQSGSIREAERMLVYVALAAAIALVLRRDDAPAVAAGVFAGTVAIAVYAFATRTFQDRFETYDSPIIAYRLSEPIGYWNSLGLLAAIGILLALGFVAHARRLPVVAVAGAALPVLFATLYFTFSRGAWFALALGAIALVALDPRRLRVVFMLLAVLPASALAVAVGSRQDALTTEGAQRAEAVSQGHRYALVVTALALGACVLALAGHWVGSRLAAPGWAARALDAGLVALLVAGFVAGVVLAGGPRDALADIKRRFDAPLAATGANLNERLFDISGNGRSESIGVAWDAGSERPIVGHGAGSYEYLWYERRPSASIIRDAHSLYAEVFAELGFVGVVLLGLAVLVPLVGAVRARGNWIVPASAGAYAAWVAHTGMDWHWEVVGVTVVALLIGGVSLLAADRGAVRPLTGLARWPLLAGSVVLTIVSLFILVGNQALFAGREALTRKDWSGAAKHARLSERLLPWSFEPQVVLGDAAARRGDRTRALAEYRRAVAADSRNWVVWLRLGQVARGMERRHAYVRVRELNPREPGRLPGEPEARSP
jgi:hypothetical protein